MKILVSKLFFGAAIVMMSSMISCKDKNNEMNDADMDTTSDPTTTMPADTTGMSTDTTTVTP